MSRRFLSKDVETSSSTWSPEECMELRRLVTLHYFRQIFTKTSMATDTFASSWRLKVKRVVRSGTSDKEQIWLQVRWHRAALHDVMWLTD